MDHITDTYQYLASKYKGEVDWLISGDVNELKIDTILTLNPKMCQVVEFKTRHRSKSDLIHDPIITTLSGFYRKPVGLPPLKPDTGLSESDHLIVFMEPLINQSDISAAKF